MCRARFKTEFHRVRRTSCYHTVVVVVISRWGTNKSFSLHPEISADESNEIVIVLRRGGARSRRVFANPAGEAGKSRRNESVCCTRSNENPVSPALLPFLP